MTKELGFYVYCGTPFCPSFNASWRADWNPAVPHHQRPMFIVFQVFRALLVFFTHFSEMANGLGATVEDLIGTIERNILSHCGRILKGGPRSYEQNIFRTFFGQLILTQRLKIFIWIVPIKSFTAESGLWSISEKRVKKRDYQVFPCFTIGRQFA